MAAPTHAPGAKNDEAAGPLRRQRDLVFRARPVLWRTPPPFLIFTEQKKRSHWFPNPSLSNRML